MFSVLTAYISPAITSFVAFMGYVFPVLWILNFLLFALWAAKKRWHALFPLLALILSWGHWQNTFQWKGNQITSQTQLHNPVKVMSFNVRMFDYYNWIGSGTREQIFELINKENPDVLCLQEFYTSKNSSRYNENYILRRLNQYRYKHIEYRSGNKGKRNFGLVTFSKYPIAERASHKFENSSNFSIQTDIKTPSGRIRIFNNHLESIKFSHQQLNFLDSLNFQDKKERNDKIKAISYKLKNAFKYRAMQAENIGRHISNSPYPVIVCGDFNDTPVSYVYRKMRGDLNDAFVESGKGFGGTYNGSLPSFRIDFLFYDDRFVSYDFKRLKVNLSDHYPVVTTLDIIPDNN